MPTLWKNDEDTEMKIQLEPNIWLTSVNGDLAITPNEKLATDFSDMKELSKALIKARKSFGPFDDAVIIEDFI